MKNNENVIWYDWNGPSGFEIQEMNKKEQSQIIQEIEIEEHQILFKPQSTTCQCRCNVQYSL